MKPRSGRMDRHKGAYAPKCKWNIRNTCVTSRKPCAAALQADNDFHSWRIAVEVTSDLRVLVQAVSHALERGESIKHAMIAEGQELGQQHARQIGGRIKPVIAVGQSGP